LIDFEGACRIDQTDSLPWGSPDYVPPRYRGKFSRRAGTLEDDYALGVIGFQFLSGEFPPVEKHARAAVYRRTKCPQPLRKKIERLIDLAI
jgi:serine/threonine protein kinase